jgi:hypothetical protein
LTAHFKHSGDFRGRRPTGKEGSIRGSDRIRIAGGKIAEIWNDVDLEGAETQLGFSPKLT